MRLKFKFCGTPPDSYFELGETSEVAKHMNERERFLRYMHFQPVDRIPLMEMGLWPETIERWHHEGLPKWVTSIRHLEDYLRLDRSFNVNWLPINGDIYPPFEEKGKVLKLREISSSRKAVQGTLGRYRQPMKATLEASYSWAPMYVK